MLRKVAIGAGVLALLLGLGLLAHRFHLIDLIRQMHGG